MHWDKSSVCMPAEDLGVVQLDGPILVIFDVIDQSSQTGESRELMLSHLKVPCPICKDDLATCFSISNLEAQSCQYRHFFTRTHIVKFC